MICSALQQPIGVLEFSVLCSRVQMLLQQLPQFCMFGFKHALKHPAMCVLLPIQGYIVRQIRVLIHVPRGAWEWNMMCYLSMSVVKH